MIKNFFKNHSIHKKIVPFLDELFFLSPMNYFFSWSIICVGIYLNLFLFNLSPQFLFSFNINYFFLFLGLSSILSSIYIQKDLDRNDKKNKVLNFIKEKYSMSKIMFFIKVLGVLGVLTLFFVSWFNAFLGLILFFLYKGYKYRFNNLLIYYFLEFFILFYSGWFYTKVEYTNREILLSDILYIFPYFLLCYCIYKSKLLINKYKDLEYSLKRYDFSVSICLLLLILSLAVGIINHDPLLSIVVITSIIFYFYSFLRSEYKDLIRSFTYPLAIFNLFLMTIFPYLFIFHFILFYISKYYNWHRFDIHHPTFLVDND
tara:strand:- start:1217 stop:2164 length:948 start_codon:yes stop_codon:yes gene_type:complete